MPIDVSIYNRMRPVPTPMQTLGQLAELKTQQINQQTAQQNQQINAVKLQEVQRAQQAQQQANQVIANLPKLQTGEYDVGGLLQGMASANVPIEEQQRAATTFDGLNKIMRSVKQGHVDANAEIANVLLQAHPDTKADPITADDVHHAYALSKDMGLPVSDEDEQAVVNMMAQGADPEKVLKTARGLGSKWAKAETFKEAPAGATVYSDLTGKPSFTTPTKISNRAELALAAQKGDPDAAAALQSMEKASPEPVVTVRTMENGKPVEKILPRSQAMGQTFPSQPPMSVIYPRDTAAGAAASQALSDVKESVQGMKEGTIPPQLPGRASKEYTALMAEAHRQKFDLVKANEDWQATQRYLSTLNGQQQVRLRQAIQFTSDSLPIVESLAKQWDAGKFPLLNAANLKLAKNGAYGQQAASLATKLDAQIADLTSELGTVYKGGNSSTDESLALAAKNLQSDWSKQTLLDNVAQIRQNLAIRQNSIRQGAPMANQGNPYQPKTEGARIRVKRKADGATGTILERDYDPAKYDKVP